ncbi:MAG: PASTA domain-containing protein, partial [Erysipelotrichaceae bacterium]|nr:PASTA domain-containing protein [Erysipelotrichaceae bacterium]
MKILKNKQTVILLSITFVLTIITGAALILFLNSPVKTIELPEFTEKTIQEIMSWKDANELSDNQVIYQYEYSEDKEKDTVLAQSAAAGTNLKEEDQIIFTVSKGYDPDKEIELPEDMDKMTEEQLSTYFETNRFSDVTFEYVVSDKVKKDYFVSINVKESSAKRSDMIIIQISAGTESVGIEIPTPDFSEYTKSSIDSWAKTNNITVNYKQAYSDTVESGKVISQSAEKNSIIKTGDSITITISNGKAIKVDDLKGKTKSDVEKWVKETNAKVEYISYYADSTEKDKVISTSPSSGSVSESTTIKIYVSLGSVKMIDFTGKKEADVKTWISTINKSIYAKENYITYKIVEADKKSDAKSGTILKTNPKKDETVKLAGVITVTVEPEKTVNVTSFAGKTETEFKKFIEDNNLALGTKTESYSTTIAKDSIIKNDTGNKVEEETKINYTVSIGKYAPKASDFDGKSENEVKNIISEANKKNAGFQTPAFTKEFSDTVTSGKTFGCSVSSNKVTCKLSQGKGVAVPNYVGQSNPCGANAAGSCSVTV